MEKVRKLQGTIGFTPELDAALEQFVHELRVRQAVEGVPRMQRSSRTSVVQKALADYMGRAQMSEAVRARLSRYVATLQAAERERDVDPDDMTTEAKVREEAVNIYLGQRNF